MLKGMLMVGRCVVGSPSPLDLPQDMEFFANAGYTCLADPVSL